MSWFSAKRPRVEFEPVPKNAFSANNIKPGVNVRYTRNNYKVMPNQRPSLVKEGSYFNVKKTRKRKTRQRKTRRSRT